MTHTTTIVQRGVFGDMQYRVVTVDVTSYTSAGEVITADEFGLFAIRHMICGGVSESGYNVAWNGGLKILSWMGDYSSATDGPLVDTTSTTDIGVVTVMVFGI